MGIRVPPGWWINGVGDSAAPAGERVLRQGAGAGWGDGAHPTTQLCLQAIGFLAPRAGGFSMLDFGAGSGLLAIAGARLGGVVDAVEIDPAGLLHGQANAALNGVAERVRYRRSLEGLWGPYDLVVANILGAVLMDHAEALAKRVGPGGSLVLSGLVGTDVPVLGARYDALLPGKVRAVYAREAWRALVFGG